MDEYKEDLQREEQETSEKRMQEETQDTIDAQGE